jgi:CarD family transcriptional regulator
MDSGTELFEPGEKVMYPQFGLGTIAGVTKKQVNGTSLSFYRLEFPLKQMEILVPVKRASENGLRRVMSHGEVEQVLEYVSCAPPSSKPQQWHRWRKRTLEQLKSGNPLEIAKIYCYLHSLEGKKGLSFTERKILLQVERMLISEIAVAKQISEDQVEAIIARSKEARLATSRPAPRPNGRANGAAPVNGRTNGATPTNGHTNGASPLNGRANGANGVASAAGRTNGAVPLNGRAKGVKSAAPLASRTHGTARAAARGAGNVNGRANGKGHGH